MAAARDRETRTPPAPGTRAPSRRAVLATAAGALAVVGTSRLLSPPASAARLADDATGRQEALKPFDDLMARFLKEHEVPGASLAVTRRGKLVYARGFGRRSPTNDAAVAADTPFRIASISKPFTAVAVLQLAERKGLDLDKPVLECFAFRQAMGGGRDLGDPRWRNVTVRHCLHHTSGMDRDKSGDPIGMLGEVRKATGVTYPIPPEAVIGFALGRPLDADPGQRYAYSNVGYLILGRIIEAWTGRPYADVVRDEVLKPIGITGMRLARALPEDRPPAEAGYFDRKNRTGPGVYPPKVGQPVPLCDGASNIEAYEAHGGWVASAVDLVRFAAAFDDRRACPLLSEKSLALMYERPAKAAGDDQPDPPVYYGCGWQVRQLARRAGDGGAGDGVAGESGCAINAWHSGLLLPGTSTLLVRRHDGLNWAVLFNTDADPKGKALAGIIDPLVHRAADAVTAWPDRDGFADFRR
jgi:CubicO group peptidase (beta-lactamase class C family)